MDLLVKTKLTFKTKGILWSNETERHMYTKKGNLPWKVCSSLPAFHILMVLSADPVSMRPFSEMTATAHTADSWPERVTRQSTELKHRWRTSLGHTHVYTALMFSEMIATAHTWLERVSYQFYKNCIPSVKSWLNQLTDQIILFFMNLHVCIHVH